MAIGIQLYTLLVTLVICSLTVFSNGEDVYSLKANDEVELKVFQEEDLDTKAKLTLTGEATFPLIGTQNLLGLSLEEATELIRKAYDKDYLISPRVTLNLLSASNEIVTVMGEVEKTGEVIIPQGSPLDLVSVIQTMGGLTSEALRSSIQLKRGDETLTYDFDRMTSGGTPNVFLKNGDRINVLLNPNAGHVVTIIGQVRTPMEIDFPLNTELDLKTVIGRVGGLTPQADKNAIEIKRGASSFRPSLSRRTILEPGDVINVPESRFVGLSVSVNDQVNRPGAVPFPLDGKMSILDAVNGAGGITRIGNKKKIYVSRKEGDNSKIYTINLIKIVDGKEPLFYLKAGDIISVPERKF